MPATAAGTYRLLADQTAGYRSALLGSADEALVIFRNEWVAALIASSSD